MQGQLPQIVAIEREYIEGVKLHFVIVLPAVQTIEVGDPVHAKQSGFPIEDKLLGSNL